MAAAAGPAQGHRLARLLAPQSIVVIGGTEAGRVIAQCDRLGFSGSIWPVNPRRDSLQGRKCFSSLSDLPGVPDAAFVAVPWDQTIEAASALNAMGCGGAVCYASGFAEVGVHGTDRQRRLLDAAGAMPIIGPNCYGCINALQRLALWPDHHGMAPVVRGAAIITQSGNMGINFTMSKRGLPLACLMSLGNQAQVKVSDCLEALLDDDRIDAIGLHIEGVDDAARFSRAAIRALEQGVPLVALKTGRSEKGARATISHTSTIAGSDRLYDALFERYGIARVTSITAFLETLKLLCVVGPLPGNTMASLSCSGGEASLIADRAEPAGLVFPDLVPEHAARVRSTLNEFVEIANPLDYHTFIWGNRQATAATFDAMLSGGFDMTVLILDFPTAENADVSDWHMTLDVFAEAARKNDARAAVLATLPEGLSETTANSLVARGVAPLIGIDDALSAIKSAATIGAKRKREDIVPMRPVRDRPRSSETLDEWHAKRILSQFGLQVPPGILTTPAKAVADARGLGFPVALKAVGAHVSHKSELGAVRLNLHSAKEVAKAARELGRQSTGLLVEHMVPDAVAELIVGVTRDPQFGPYLVIGAGGVFVELLDDTALLPLPTTKSQIRRAIMGLGCAPALLGFRGRPEADVTAAVGAAWIIAKFATKYWDTIVELDVNPLIVCENGKGAVAADALIRIAEGTFQ